MKIKDLKKIEEFDVILVDALNKYIDLFSKETVSFHYEKYNFRLYINENINIVFGSNADYGKFINIRNEFSFDRNIIKRILKFAYVFLATQKYTRKLFATGFITYNKKCDFVDRSVIIPGRNKIRFQLEDGSIFVGKKCNASQTSFQREIFARQFHVGVNAPPILTINSETGFQEKGIIGRPINRTKPKREFIYKKKVIEILQKSSLWRNKYYHSVQSIFRRTCKNLYKVSPELASRYHLVYLHSMHTYQDLKVCLLMSHGDLQSANILFEDEDIFVIDWESYGLRTELYDIFTLLSDLRLKRDILSAMCKFMEDASFAAYTHTDLPRDVTLFLWWSDEILFNIEQVFLQQEYNRSYAFQNVKRLIDDGITFFCCGNETSKYEFDYR